MRKLVLWGHQVSEYQAMFDLSTELLKTSIFEYGCGLSAVNATLHHQGTTIVSCDPLFCLTKSDLMKETEKLTAERIQQIRADVSQFDVDAYGGLDAFIQSRLDGIGIFFDDYEQGRIENRYISCDDQRLPLGNFSFNLALVSNDLFTDPDQQSLDFHLETIKELARIAHEVRVFPLVDRYGQPSPLIGPVLLGLQQQKYGVEVREVPYALYPKGNAMLRVWAEQCVI